MFHINGIIQYVVFCVWLLSLECCFCRFIDVIEGIGSSLYFIVPVNSIPLYAHTTFCLSIFFHQLMNI